MGVFRFALMHGADAQRRLVPGFEIWFLGCCWPPADLPISRIVRSLFRLEKIEVS